MANTLVYLCGRYYKCCYNNSNITIVTLSHTHTHTNMWILQTEDYHSTLTMRGRSLSDSSSLPTLSLCHTGERTHTPERRFINASGTTCVWSERETQSLRFWYLPRPSSVTALTQKHTNTSLCNFFGIHTCASVVFRKRALRCFLPCKSKSHCVHVFTQNLFNSVLCGSRLIVKHS